MFSNMDNNNTNANRKRSNDLVKGYKVANSSNKKSCPQFRGDACTHCNDMNRLSGHGSDSGNDSNDISILEVLAKGPKLSKSLNCGNLISLGWVVCKSVTIRTFECSNTM